MHPNGRRQHIDGMCASASTTQWPSSIHGRIWHRSFASEQRKLGRLKGKLARLHAIAADLPAYKQILQPVVKKTYETARAASSRPDAEVLLDRRTPLASTGAAALFDQALQERGMRPVRIAPANPEQRIESAAAWLPLKQLVLLARNDRPVDNTRVYSPYRLDMCNCARRPNSTTDYRRFFATSLRNSRDRTSTGAWISYETRSTKKHDGRAFRAPQAH